MSRSKIDIAELQNREKTLSLLRQATRERLRKLGFEPVSKPERLLDIPLDITRVDSRTLGKLFHLSIAWENYAGDQLAYSRIASLLADYSYELVLAQQVKLREGGIQQRKAESLTSPKVRSAKLDVLNCSSRVVAFESQFSRYTRISQALSREQTRREKLSQGD
jgi:hypothetical protein